MAAGPLGCRMRHLPVVALLLTATAAADIMTLSPSEKPLSVTSGAGDFTIRLSMDSVVHFSLSKERATSMEITVAGRRSVLQLDSCAVPRMIHSEGMELIRDDLRDDEHRTDGFTLLFDVGPEGDRRFGKLPRIQLTWTNGRIAVALITRLVAANNYHSSPLCDR
jgi:hypothetical protein